MFGLVPYSAFETMRDVIAILLKALQTYKYKAIVIKKGGVHLFGVVPVAQYQKIKEELEGE